MPVRARSSVDRKPVWASFWQFDPTTEEEPIEVEAMDAALSFMQSDVDRVLIAVRGKPTTRYETGDSVWLELTTAEALRLIERLSAVVAANVAEASAS